jgi:hypothetical protein
MSEAGWHEPRAFVAMQKKRLEIRRLNDGVNLCPTCFEGVNPKLWRCDALDRFDSDFTFAATLRAQGEDIAAVQSGATYEERVATIKS